MKAKANLFRTLLVLPVVLLVALLVASAPASAQEGSSVVAGTDPSDQQIGVLRDTDVKAFDGWGMDQTTITTDTFTLVEQGTTSPVEASVGYYAYCYESGGPCWAALDPKVDLEANTTYTATLKGGENGIKTFYGAQMAGDYSWSFTTGDSTAPPETTLTEWEPCGPFINGNGDIYWLPCGPITSTSATFNFISSKANSTFECSLDGAAFTSCTSPKAYTGVSVGDHTFRVRATDASGNTDPTPASAFWTVVEATAAPDATAPKVDTLKATSLTGSGAPRRATDFEATFSEKMDASTLNTTTFKLFKCSSTTSTTCTTQITDAPVKAGADGLSATLNPFGGTATTLLQAKTKYKVVVTTGAKDAAGNALDQDPSTTGNQQKVAYFTTRSG
jgi:hypothetical protein